MTNIFSYKGKASRMEFFITTISAAIITCFAGMMIDEYTVFPVKLLCIALLSAAFVWIISATATRRCHDLGYNGWTQLHPIHSLKLLFSK